MMASASHAQNLPDQTTGPEPRIVQAPRADRRLAWFPDSESVTVGLLCLVVAGLGATAAGWQIDPLLRLFFAFAGLVFLPGYALSRLLLSSSDAHWPERLAVSIGLGSAVHGVLALAVLLLGLELRYEIVLLPAIGLLVFLLALRKRSPMERPGGGEKKPFLAWAVLAITILVVVFWSAGSGTPVGIFHDSLDHVAFVERIAQSGTPFPHDAYFADSDEVTGADPRKGLYHSLVAIVVMFTDLSPLAVWKLSAAIFAPLLVLAGYCLGRRVGASPAAGALAAVLVMLTYGGGLAAPALREAVYSTKVADFLALMTVWSMLLALSKKSVRALVLTAVLAFAAVTTHVFSAVYLALVWGALTLGVLLAYDHLPIAIRFESKAAWLRRSFLLAILLLVVGAPFLVLRWQQAYAPADPIHLEPQGLLYWWGTQLYSVNFWVIAEWLGWPGIALLLTLPFLWRARAIGLGPVYLVSVTVAVFFVVMNPLVLPLAHQAIGYLVMRLIWCVPVAVGLALAIVLALRSLRQPEGTATKGMALVALGVALLGLSPTLVASGRVIAGWETPRTPEDRLADSGWQDLISELEQRWQEPKVLLSDPATSYRIAAETEHYVTAVMPQHGTPNDPRGEKRITDARDALSPYTSYGETLEILHKYGVDAVVLNHRLSWPIIAGPWINQPKNHRAALKKFESHPETFEEVWVKNGIHLFSVHPVSPVGAPDTGSEAPPLQFTRVSPANTDGWQESEGIFHHRTEFEPRVVHHSETVRFSSFWSRQSTGITRPGDYRVAVLLTHQAKDDPLYVPAIGKLYRQVLEMSSGNSRSLEHLHVPVDGLLSPDRWPEDMEVRDEYEIHIPENLKPGSYQVHVRMMRVPVHYNSSLSQFFSDNSPEDGPVVGVLTVAAQERGGS